MSELRVKIRKEEASPGESCNEALRESEERYRAFVANSSEAIWRFEFAEHIPVSLPADEQVELFYRHGYLAECNDAMARMYGHASADEIVGARPSDLMPDTEQTRAFYRAVIDSGYRLADAETSEQTAAGETRLFLNNMVGVVEGGRLRRVWGTQRDITERVMAENALRESEERYRELFEDANDLIYTQSLDGRYLSMNGAGERITGYTREEAMSLCMADVLAPEYVELARQKLAAKLAGAWEGAYEVEIVSKDGRRVPLEVNSRLIYKNGVPVGVQGIARDITERKRAEKALAEAGGRAITEYEKLLERIAVVGQELGTARELAAVFRAVNEFARASAPCNGIFISLYDERRGQRRAVFACSGGVEVDVRHVPPMPMTESPHSRAIATGSLVVEDDLQRAVEGQPTFPVGVELDPRAPRSALVVPMSVMGRIIGAIELQSVEPAAFTRAHATAMRMAANLAAAAIENVRLLEQERESAEKFRQAQKMEAIGRLAGGVAHDFNNLLTVINGYSDLSLRRVEQHGPIRHNLEEIRKAGERAAALTRQLLAFSRQQVLQPVVLNLNAVVRDMEKMLRRLIGEDVELMTSLGDDLWSIKADPGQLEQVILNLAVNARDAMPKGGRLTITTSEVYLDEEYAGRHIAVRPGGYVLLTVSDNGCGIMPEVQKNIFEPFYTTKEQGKGTGLGLSMVYGIVKQSGGNIWVYSEPGQGTTFKVYLPVAEEEAEEAAAARAGEAQLPGGVETVLLAEDDPVVRRMTREILEMYGYTVLDAPTGGEVVRLCERHAGTIHMLLTDVVMPQLSGKELADGLTLVRPGLKVLYMSGYTDEAIVHHGVLEKGVNFIQKPFTPAALARKVRDVLDAGREVGVS